MSLSSVALTVSFVIYVKGISPTVSRDPLIMCSRDFFKKALSLLLLGQGLPILASCNFSRLDQNHRVKWPIYPVIKLYSQKGASPGSQRQWPSNLVGLWVRVKEPHLLFQVNCRSSDCVLFEKRHVSTNAGLQNSVGNIKHRKLTNQKLFLLFKRY